MLCVSFLIPNFSIICNSDPTDFGLLANSAVGTVRAVASVSEYVCNRTLDTGYALTGTLAFFNTPGAQVISKMLTNYCLNDMSQQISKLLNSDIKVAKSLANDAIIAFENKRFDEVQELLKKSYVKGLKGMNQSTTWEQAAYCVNFVLACKMALEMFDKENKTFVEFWKLDSTAKNIIAQTIIQKIEEFGSLQITDAKLKAFIRQV